MRKRFIGVLAAVLPLAFLAPLGCGENLPPAAVGPQPAVAQPTPVAPPAPPPPAAPVDEAPRPPKPVMADAQRTFLAALEAGLVARDAKKVAALYATGAVMTSAAREGVHESVGRTEIEAARARGFAVIGKAIPDMKWVHTRALQKGDVMVVEWVGMGTNTGGFLDDKATNRKVGWRGISIFWFDDDGLVARETNVLDPVTVMGQLGRGDPSSKFRAPPSTTSGPTQFIAAKESPEEQKHLDSVKAMYPLFEKKDEKALLAVFTDDAVRSDQTKPDDAKGKDGIKKELGGWLKAYPDLKLEVEEAWAFGDVVVTEVATTGTLDGKRGTTHGVDVVEMKNGKIARMTSYANGRERLAAYGLMPKPATTPAKN